MRIGIVGLGYVGLTLAIVAADCGIEVYGIEVNPEIKNCLKNNRVHFHETGLNELIEKHNQNKNFILSARKISESLEDAVVDWTDRHIRRGGSCLIRF